MKGGSLSRVRLMTTQMTMVLLRLLVLLLLLMLMTMTNDDSIQDTNDDGGTVVFDTSIAATGDFEIHHDTYDERFIIVLVLEKISKRNTDKQ